MSTTGASSACTGRFGGNVVVSGRPSIASTSVASVSSDGRRRPYDLAVTEDRHRVGQLEHLAQEVGDEHDRLCRRGERAHDLVQLGRLGRAERRRRLVHDDDPRVAREGPQDLGFLLLGRSQLAGARVAGKVEARRGRPAPRRPAEGSAPDEPEAPRLGAQANVLGDGELWDERRLLGDRRDPVIERLARRAEGGRRSVEEHPTSVRRVNAGDYPAERRLARAVLADDRVDGAQGDRERDVIERTDASEVLRDALELEVGHVVRSPASWSS